MTPRVPRRATPLREALRSVAVLFDQERAGSESDPFARLTCHLCGYEVIAWVGTRGWQAPCLAHVAKHANGHLAGR